MRSSCLPLLFVALSTAGCEAALTPSITPTIDTRGKAGFETRVDLSVSIGSREVRVYESVAPNGGYHEELGGYGGVSSTVGMHFGDVSAKPLVRGHFGGVVTARFGEHGTYWGPGGMLELAFGFAETKEPFGVWLAGARFQGDVIFGLEPEPGRPEGVTHTRAMFSPGFFVQWIFWGFYLESRDVRIVGPRPPPPGTPRGPVAPMPSTPPGPVAPIPSTPP